MRSFSRPVTKYKIGDFIRIKKGNKKSRIVNTMIRSGSCHPYKAGDVGYYVRGGGGDPIGEEEFEFEAAINLEFKLTGVDPYE